MNTNEKGAIALTKTIADLTVKGYNVFCPISEHSKIDLIAEKDGKLIKLQVKYCGDDIISVRNFSVTVNKKGNKHTKYQGHEIDYYAIYSSCIDKVIYPAFKFGGKYIRTTKCSNGAEFWWYEDFLEISGGQEKRITPEQDRTYHPCHKLRKVKRPSKNELEAMIEEKPVTSIAESYSVTESAVRKWCKIYGIKTKPRGYFK